MTAERIEAYKQAAQYVSILLLLLASATGVGYLFRYVGIDETNIVIIYILSTLITARLTPGYAFGIITSFAATFMFNLFFAEPYLTISVSDPGYIVTFVIMTVTALITSALTSKVKKNALEAGEKEAEFGALYKLTNRLTDATDIETIAYTAVSAISDALNCAAACLCFDHPGMPECIFVEQSETNKPTRRNIGDCTDIKRTIASLHTAYYAGTDFFDFPIYGHEATLGIIRIPTLSAIALDNKQLRILHSMIENTALAMDRFYIAQQQLKAREETELERYRSNLLRAISHDLRTPLSGILGSSKMLGDIADDKDAVIAVAGEIYQEADWLHSMVENILNLTRLQGGRLVLHKEPEAVEEVIGFAVGAISRRYPSAKITVQAPDELLIIPMDAKLISQVLINLLDNAVQHAGSSDFAENIIITVSSEGSTARFSVSDEGPGLHEEDLPNIFEMFYTEESRRHVDSKHGIGLGLTICKAIVNAHGGEITARNRTDKQGAEFTFTLPA